MSSALITYYVFMFTAAASAIALLFARSVFKGALWFLICLLSIAGLFVLSYAEFVAVTQILIYAGGVLVVILFGIMFTSKLAAKPLRVENTNVIGGIVAGTLIFGLLTKLVLENTVVTEIASSPRAIESIGLSLMTDYALPFEVIGLLLLITLIGASVVTAFMKEKKQ